MDKSPSILINGTFVALLLTDYEGDLNDVLRERMSILSKFIDIFRYYKQQILICLENERKENRNILLRLLLKNIGEYLIFIEKPSSK